jgi:type IV pilus assembly protein PilE
MHMDQIHRAQGFTLTELLITIAVAAIISMVAIPAYQDQVTRGKRTEGQAALVNLANRMEKHFYDSNTYATAAVTTLMGSATTESGYYQLQISPVSTLSYTLRAIPTGTFRDAGCQTLTLDQAGSKGVTGGATKSASDCW